MPFLAFLLSPTGLRILMAVGIAVAVAGAYHATAEHFRAQGRAEVQARWDKAVAEARAEQARLEALYKKQVQEANDAVEKLRTLDAAKFAELRDEITRLRNRPPVAVSSAALGVWNDAAGAANATGDAGGGKAAAVAIPDAARADKGTAGVSLVDAAELDAFVLDAAAAYADARTKWAACVGFYETLRNAK